RLRRRRRTTCVPRGTSVGHWTSWSLDQLPSSKLGTLLRHVRHRRQRRWRWHLRDHAAHALPHRGVGGVEDVHPVADAVTAAGVTTGGVPARRSLAEPPFLQCLLLLLPLAVVRQQVADHLLVLGDQPHVGEQLAAELALD